MLSILQTLSYNVKSSKYFKETFGCQTKPRVFKENLLLNCSEYLSDKKGWRCIIFTSYSAVTLTYSTVLYVSPLRSQVTAGRGLAPDTTHSTVQPRPATSAGAGEMRTERGSTATRAQRWRWGITAPHKYWLCWRGGRAGGGSQSYSILTSMYISIHNTQRTPCPCSTNYDWRSLWTSFKMWETVSPVYDSVIIVLLPTRRRCCASIKFCVYWCHNWRTLEAADTNGREWRLICLGPGRRWPNIKTVIKWFVVRGA